MTIHNEMKATEQLSDVVQPVLALQGAAKF